MTITQQKRVERGLEKVIKDHRTTRPIVILLHDEEMEFCPATDTKTRDKHRALGKEEVRGRHIVLRTLRELLFQLRNQAPTHLNRGSRQTSAASMKDQEIRAATRTSSWRGPFVQGGAPGLGKKG
jgi:hypothetical protein